MPPSRGPGGRPVEFVAAFLGGSVAQIAVVLALSATDPSPFTSRGVPGALGVMISVMVAILAGPLAGVLVALIGGTAFAILVADAEVGGFVAIVVWTVAALLAGVVADRYRSAGRERDLAHEAERRARQAAESESQRLAHLQALTARLANAVTVREVGEALAEAMIDAFGATAAGIAQLSEDGREFVSITARGYDPALVERFSRFPVDTPVILADVLASRSVVTVADATEALERYPMLGTFGPEYPLGAQAAAPLLAGDEILGVLGINFDHARRFDPEDEALLLAVGRQCGQAVQRARLFEAERRARERAVELRELASALAAASTPGDIANLVPARVLPLLGGTRAIVGAVSLDGDAIELVNDVGVGEGTRPAERIPLSSDRPEAEVVRSQRLLLLGSPEVMGSRASDLVQPDERSGDRAWAGVPLIASGRTLGVLAVTYGEPQTFDDRQVAELETVADQLALALERSMLQRSREEAVRLEARVQRVKAVSEAMNPGLGVGEVAAAILAEAAEALGAAAGGLGVVTPDGRNFEFMSRIGAVRGTATRVPLETPGPTTDAFRTGKIVRIEHAEDWRREYPKGSPLLGEFAEAVLSVPISAAGRRIGAIGLRFDRERSFSPDELRFVGSLAEEAGEALERARLFEAEQRALRRAARLQEVTARLSRAVTTEDAARAILRAATAGVGAQAAAIALAENDGRSLRVVPGQMARGTLRLRPPFDLPVTDHGALAHVYRSGRTQSVESEEAWRGRFAEDLEALRVLGTCMFAFPIVSRGEPIGALAVFFREHTPELSSEDEELIRSFAQQAGVALERARTYEVEHEAAVTLQRNLMPEQLAHEPSVDVVGRYLPATRGVHVGGDWYDLVDRPDGTVALAVGDIAGHGLPAAAAMGQVRSAWRALALSSSDPAAILGSLDRFAAGVEGAFFSTILTMLLDPSTNELRYASAGHPPALVIDADHTARFLEGGRSVPLGLPFDLPRPQAIEHLSPGAVLVLYTDGLIERRDEPLDQGLQRLETTASQVAGAPLVEVADTLLELVAGDRHDDVALLAVGPKLPAEVFRRSFPADPRQLAMMRAELRGWLDRSGLPTETKEDVVLACTEAAANAIEHAYIGRDGDIRVVGESDDGWLKIEVSDDGRWRDPRPDDSRGRGLDLVRTLIGDIDVERGEHGTTVRMRVGVA
jgi:GAF domain-containing protein/anti-sigma regulatory factor (Ser/Thr protein kinase)